jgi:hypothetical protein
MELGARAIRAPATVINPERFSKCFLRSPTAFVPSLFQLESFVKAPTLPGSIFRSRSSEKRSMGLAPFDSDAVYSIFRGKRTGSAFV